MLVTILAFRELPSYLETRAARGNFALQTKVRFSGEAHALRD